MEPELAEVRDFLAAHPPFDALPAPALTRLPSLMEIRYFRRGEVIRRPGQRAHEMYVLRSGAVDIRDADGVLVERSDPGTSFGMSALLDRTGSLFEFTAIEDSLCLVVPAEVFLSLCDEHEPVRAFFDRSSRRRERPATVTDRGTAHLRTRASDLVRREPITTTTGTSVREAARVMREHGVSSLLVMDGSRLAGILTDRDLRNRVVTGDHHADEPVERVMTPDPVTGSAESLAFELLLEMVQRNIHHLPLVDGQRVIGVVTGTDLMRLEHANPIYIVGDIAKAQDVDAVVALSRRLPVVVHQLTAQSTTADDTSRVATAVRDALERRLLQLAEQELGPPPVPYCWVVLGSQARLEVALAGDQDNALVLDDAGSPDDADTADHGAYFARLAHRVSDALAACGYQYCAGQVMATNPRWRQPFSAWRRGFSDWMGRPEPQAVLTTSIFFDMRGLHGAVELARRLQDHVLSEAPDRRTFLTHLAGHAVSAEPPLGFFRQFVLEGAGEHRDTLDLKARGLAPVAEVARVHALAAGTPALNTHARLRAAATAGRVNPQSAEDLSGAFEFIAAARLRHQTAQVRQGRAPDNHLRPDELSSLERRHLRDAFRVVKQAQAVLAATHGTRLVT